MVTANYNNHSVTMMEDQFEELLRLRSEIQCMFARQNALARMISDFNGECFQLNKDMIVAYCRMHDMQVANVERRLPKRR